MYNFDDDNFLMDMYIDFLKMAQNVTLNKIDGHECDHSARVAILGIGIGLLEKLNDIDIKMLKLAGIFHDSGRVDDTANALHGVTGASNVMNSIIDENFKRDIAVMVEYHAIDDNEDELLEIMDKYDIASDKREHLRLLCSCLKDADALDRVRFGCSEYCLDKRLLRTKSSFELISFAEELYKKSIDFNKKKVLLELKLN